MGSSFTVSCSSRVPLVGFPNLFRLGREPCSLRAQSSSDSPGEGLQFHILGVSIDETRRPVATCQITDDAGHPLLLSDLDDPPRFTLARLHIDAETGLLSEWVSYIVSTVSGQPYNKDGKELQPVLASATQAGLDPTGQSSSTPTSVVSASLPESFDLLTLGVGVVAHLV
jgi:hypothetical protein